MIAIVVIVLTPILAQLMYFALSRRREYLADASGALFTRYPEGLAGALEKLGGGKVAQADKSQVTAPMYIVRPLTEDKPRKLSASFSTHPPLEDRIKILRSMAGGSGYQDYEKAYRKAHGGEGLIGARSLAGAGEVQAMQPEADTSKPVERQRAASDAFLGASGYVRKTCTSCGAIHKVPPALVSRLRDCTRCKTPLPS